MLCDNSSVFMQVADIIEQTQAKVLTLSSDQSQFLIDKAFSSDLMSDVLTIDTENLMLITGLNNLQTIRTAEMAEVRCILFARNKRPDKEMIALAENENIVLLISEKSVFHLSGLLFSAGLKPVF